MGQTSLNRLARQSIRAKHKELLRDMQVGDSFFVKGRSPSHLGYVRALGYSLGMKLAIRKVEVDQIYGTSGCRVARVG